MDKSLDREFTGNTTAVDGWTVWKCEEGEFECIVIQLANKIMSEYLYR
jgi:hypothetical protein